jgi:hypothetical protein
MRLPQGLKLLEDSLQQFEADTSSMSELALSSYNTNSTLSRTSMSP